VTLDTAALTLPHPRLHERAFVLAPLADLAPEMVHPASGQTVHELVRVLPDAGGIEVYAPAGWESAPTRPG
jgi:2-amino-4-hydroxy-6-hydroxymethyldihydropteridine diphosphokinase